MYVIRNFKAFQEKLEQPVSSAGEISGAAAHNSNGEKDHLTLLTANHVHVFRKMNM